MFSKPILIAASVATAQSALLATTSTAQVEGTDFSDEKGCGACLGYLDSKWLMDGALYQTVATQPAVAITAAKVLTGGICCKSDGTKEKSDAVTYCGGAKFSGLETGNTVLLAKTASGYFQSDLAQCPFFKDNCVMTASTAADATDATTDVTDQRYAILAKSKIGAYVTLKMKALATAGIGAAPAMKQRVGDVCSWVIAADCDAPVLTVATATTGAAQWDIQVTEWTEEFLTTTANAPTGVTWLAASQVGTTKKLYPPIAVAMITDLQAVATTATTPNNIMGDVLFKTPAITGTTYLSVPGNTLADWMANIKAVYAQFDAEKIKYDAEAATWKTYAEYKAPAPGLFDWAFGAAVDPAKPATVSSPLMPTQPVAVPATIANLKVSATATATFVPAIYGGKAGYGYPSAYKLTAVAAKSGKPFGTLAGKGQFATQTVAWAAATEGILSMRKTSNKDTTKTDGYVTACNKSYLFITGVKKGANAAAAQTVILKVTSSEFKSTLEEQIPTRPGGATKAVDAPAGAAQLAASAVAAALTALYLF